MKENISEIKVRRLSIVSQKPFEEVVHKIRSLIGHPDMTTFHDSVTSAKTMEELEKLVKKSTVNDAMEFMQFDPGEILRKEGKSSKIIRLLVGNPLIMKEMAKATPDAAAYAPVTILIDERLDGVHLSYDLMEDMLEPYGSKAASIVARDLDGKIETLLKTAVE
jgi:uncharacterized protein (DUF302 family)